MAFCIYCGKKLEEGEVCDCRKKTEITGNQAAEANLSQEQQAAVQDGTPSGVQPDIQYQGQPSQQYQIQTKQAVEKSSAYLRQLSNSLLGIIKKPAEEGKKFVASGDKKLAIGFLVIQALLSGIFVMLLCNKVNNVARAAGSIVRDIESKYLFSLPKVLMITLIGSLILSFAMAVLLLAGVKLLKGNTTFWHMACVAAVRSIGKSIFILLAVVMSFLNVAWGIGSFVLSALIGWLFMIPVIQSGATLNENKQVYMVGAVIILSFVAFYVLATVGFPMYIPDSLKGDFQDLIGQLSNLKSYNGLY